jgi:hypothetical protein
MANCRFNLLNKIREDRLIRLKTKDDLKEEQVVDLIPDDFIIQYLGIGAEEFSRMDAVEQQRTKYNAYRAKRGAALISKEEWDSLLTASSGDFELANLNADRKDGGLPLTTKEEYDTMKAEFEAKRQVMLERQARMFRDRRTIALVVGGFILVLVLYSVVYSFGLLGTTRQQRGDSGKDKIGAKVACEELIKRDLKAPSTASFSGTGETRIEYLGGGTYTVRGWVDAQNSISASSRQQYVCEITRTGDDRWQKETISLN